MNNKKICTIYVVRHGESVHNVLEKKNGHFKQALEKQSELTKKGILQATNLANKFKDIAFDVLFSSDYPRAKQTAKVLNQQRRLTIKTAEALRERQQGSWEGKWSTVKYKLQEDIKKLPEDEKMKFTFDDVETEEHLYNRFHEFLRKIATTYTGKTILIVSHGNIMRTLLWKLGWATYHQLPPGSINNTAYYVIQADGVDMLIKEAHGINKIP